MDMPSDQMTRVKAKEREQEWPDSIQIVARWYQKSPQGAQISKVIQVEVTKEEFFGLGGAYGAPIGGENLVARIDRLRRGLV